jgi:hypothetical protein
MLGNIWLGDSAAAYAERQEADKQNLEASIERENRLLEIE